VQVCACSESSESTDNHAESIRAGDHQTGNAWMRT
jgi:hypothetical protein